MSEVAEPVYVSATVVEGMDEFVCDDSVHVGLLVDVVLTQNNLETDRISMLNSFEDTRDCFTLHTAAVSPYLRRGCIKSTADCPVTIFTGEVAVFEHVAGFGERKVSLVQKTPHQTKEERSSVVAVKERK